MIRIDTINNFSKTGMERGKKKLSRRYPEAFRIAFTVLIVTLFLLPAVLASGAEKFKDDDISRAVAIDLLVDKGVSAHLIDVKVEDGVVTLSGSVDNLYARNRAMRITESVKGVTAIVNLIKVNPVAREDELIQSDVNKALLADPATDSYELKVSVADGRVSLSGAVDSWAEKRLAVDVSSRVKGVKSVNYDQVSIDYKKERLDFEIGQDVRRILERDIYIDANTINIKVDDGMVTLGGSVGSLAEKNRAAIISLVNGVKSVNSENLKVQYWLRDKMARETPHVAATDKEIAAAIDTALLNDPRVSNFEIIIDVHGGAVTMTGNVDNLGAKKAATRDAENTMGVWNITNLIRVRPVPAAPLLTHIQVANNVSEALDRDYLLNSEDIAVKMSNWKVLLYGNVSSRYEKDHATEVVSLVPGVVEVENNLVITSEWKWQSDRVIEKNIREQFLWSVFVDGEDIDVSVQDGVATLEGSVASWRELKDAVNNSFEGGAESVKARLTVNGFDPVTQSYNYSFVDYHTPF